MSELLVFVSSIMDKAREDLRAERDAVRTAVQSIGITQSWRFEDSPASSRHVDDAYLAKVREADIFVIILGQELSEPVRKEYETALAAQKPILAFLKATTRTPTADAFAKSLSVKWKSFADPTVLAQEVRRALAEELIDAHRQRHLAFKTPDLARLRRVVRPWWMRIGERYFVTITDFTTQGPKRFFEKSSRDPERYLEPSLFLAVNTLVVALLLVMIGSSGTKRESLDDFLMGATIIIGNGMVYIVLAKLAGVLTRQTVRAAALFAAYAYTSWWHVLYVPMLSQVERVNDAAYVAASAVQVLFIAHFVVTCLRATTPRYAGRFSAVLIALVLVASVPGGYFIYQDAEREKRRKYATAVAWNKDANEPTLLIVNVTRNPSCTSCWRPTGDARAGDVIGLLIYYHQNTCRTARQARVRLDLPASVPTTEKLYARIWSADAASDARGEAELRNAKNQPYRLEFRDVEWRPTRTAVAALPHGQTGRELLSEDGLLLGDIPPGCEHRGTLLVRFVCASTAKAVVGVPSTPRGTTECDGESTIVLDWQHAPDATRYRVDRDGEPRGFTTRSWFRDQDIEPGTVYDYTVIPCDDHRCANTSSPATRVTAVACPNVTTPAPHKSRDADDRYHDRTSRKESRRPADLAASFSRVVYIDPS